MENTPDTVTLFPAALDFASDTVTLLPEALEFAPDTVTLLPVALEFAFDTFRLLPTAPEFASDTVTLLPAALEFAPDTVTLLPAALEFAPDTVTLLPIALEFCPVEVTFAELPIAVEFSPNALVFASPIPIAVEATLAATTSPAITCACAGIITADKESANAESLKREDKRVSLVTRCSEFEEAFTAPFANSDVTTKDCVVLFQIILNTLFIKRLSQKNRLISCCEAKIKIMQTKQVNNKVLGVYRS